MGLSYCYGFYLINASNIFKDMELAMWKYIRKISGNLIVAIPLMMLAGFAYGLLGETAWLKSLIIPFTFLMVYPMMVTLKIKKVFEGGDVKAQILTQIIN